MKTYTFSYNGGFGRGAKVIVAENKAKAIAQALEKYPFIGINISSFKVFKAKNN